MPQLDPVIWFFVLGVAAGAARADLRLPAAIYEFVSTVLPFPIGLTGGVELTRDTGGLPLSERGGILLASVATTALVLRARARRVVTRGSTRPSPAAPSTSRGTPAPSATSPPWVWSSP